MITARSDDSIQSSALFVTQLIRAVTILVLVFALLSHTIIAQEIPTTDRRATEIRHLDLTYTFPTYTTKEAWMERAKKLRSQILVSAGLWPMPEKTALNAHIFGKSDHGDFTIEKVYFESYPGHFVTGNLYRPKNVTGKLPGVLLPHGHWQYGRLENQPLNSGPTRAANFAKLGFVAFTWDMVGYNDSLAIPHTFASHREGLVRESLWGINLLGLQLWNSIRSVDFLESLPDVDADRLGCTGESGGATQTFLLTAVDERIKVSAPVNMISSIMQGGSVCENAPNLRIDTNNMEIGAMMAPRPLLMVAATGDWTKNTPTVEYPAIRSIYRLFGVEDKVQTVQFDAPHNYHNESREAVYGWFAHWLQGRAETTPIKEKSAGNFLLTDLLVFYGLPHPANELDEKGLTESLIQARKKQFDETWPHDAASLEKFKERYGAALKYSLMAEYPKPDEIINDRQMISDNASFRFESFGISRRGQGDRVQIDIRAEGTLRSDDSFVLCVSDADLWNSRNELCRKFLQAGHTLVELALKENKPSDEAIKKYKFFDTYNRNRTSNRIQDILTTIAYLRQRSPNARITLIGFEEAGAWALLARGLAPQIDRMIIDAAQFDHTSDEELLKRLPVPDIRRAGDFTTAVTIAPKTPLLIHNTGNRFQTDKMASAYRLLGKAEDFHVRSERLTDDAIIDWLRQK